MARLGIAKFEDLTGRVDLLEADQAIEHWKTARHRPLARAAGSACAPRHSAAAHKGQESPLADALDWQLIEAALPALESGLPVTGEFASRNVNRTVGGLLSHEVTKRHGPRGLPAGTVRYALHGAAGQSFGAWLAPGLELTLFGDANDYAGKGLSGGAAVPPSTPTCWRTTVAGSSPRPRSASTSRTGPSC